MKILIIKTGASGDVVRTTPLLHVLKGVIDWIISDDNAVLLSGLNPINRVIKWSERHVIKGTHYQLVINLEESYEAATLLKDITYSDLYGAYLSSLSGISYTENSQVWFDMSLIGKHGLETANVLKFNNRKSYQEIIFTGLGISFNGEAYILPKSILSNMVGDIAIAPYAGPVWPMKNWGYYDDLISILQKENYLVNILPQRSSILEHLADIRNHTYLISGDSLPMHLALGCGLRCINIFICTSPWEIYGYGLQRKIVSPNLDHYFYKRNFDPMAPYSISPDVVHSEFINLNRVFSRRDGPS